METQVQKLPELKKMPSTYKLIVPAHVEEKIRYLLRKYPHTEWSGVLFTSHEGTFEDNNLVITCQDLYPMDLGNATYTQFKMSEDVAGYLADNMNLFGCDMGLIHSHHCMSTFFSGTDTATLQSEGNDTNCFVSLIVNNAGVYSAAVTRKKVLNIESTVKHVRSSYEFFGEGVVAESGNPVETTETEQVTFIEYFMLDVEREEVSNPLAYLDTRFDEIEKKKTKSVNLYIPKENKAKEGYLWNFEDTDDAGQEDIEGTDYCPDPDLIDRAVAILLTSSFLIDSSKLDRDKWITTYMKPSFDKVFHIDENPVPFQNWAEFIIEHLIDNFDDPTAPDFYRFGEGIDSYQTLIADAIHNELKPYAKDNKYIDAYCDILCRY